MNFFSDRGIDITCFLSGLKQVILFGAGLAGENALTTLNKNGIQVLFFCDNDTNKHGKNINGIKIYPPSELQKHQHETVLISSNYFDEISSQLKKMSINKCYYFGFCFDFDRWHGHFNSVRLKESAPRIKLAHDLFADEASRNLFTSLVQFRNTLGACGCKQSTFEEYFHPAVKPKQGDTIIDGGAWTGDTAEAIGRTLDGKCNIYSFEPEEHSYRNLQEKIVSENLLDCAYPVNLGLWSETTTLRFDTSRKHSSQHKVSESGACQIRVTSIDEFALDRNIEIDLIKMDIEGSEIEALRGARETIQTFGPRLQICSYHNFDDLWEIPILIKELFPDYRLYLGHHSQNLFDTIVYAHRI